MILIIFWYSNMKSYLTTTTPQILKITAKHLDKVILSDESEGNMAERIKVNNDDDEDNMLTTAASVLAKASW